MKLVITSTADKKSAKKLANALLQANLAACVSIVKTNGIYFWEGKICDEKERLLLIKTDEKFKKIAKFIKANHDYELPEIIAFKAKFTSKEYKKWIKERV